MFQIEQTTTTKFTYKINNNEIPQELKKRIFYTLSLKLDENNRKKGRHPKGWQKLEKSIFNEKHNAVAILTGKKNGLYVVDYDNEINFKIDSELFPELKNYHERTRKGFHCYFLYNGNAEKIGSKNVKEHDIDFLGDGKCVYSFPTKYKSKADNIEYSLKLLSAKPLKGMSDTLFIYLSNKYLDKKESLKVESNFEEEKKIKINIVNEEKKEGDELSILINKMFKWGVDAVWKFEKVEGYKNSFTIYCENNNSCLVNRGLMHGEEKHSSMFVCKKYIKLQCWSHGKEELKEVVDDWEFYYDKIKTLLGIKKEKKEKVDKNKANDYQRLLMYLWEDCEENRYKKDDGFILKAVKGIPTYYKKYLSYEDYLNELFTDTETAEYWLYRKNSKIIVNLVDYLEKYNDVQIPFIKRDKHFISYINGVFDIKNLVFLKWGQEPDICSGIMFEEEFDEGWLKVKFNKIKTPIFDKLIKYQIKSNVEYKMFVMMSGRLLFDVGEMDNWQCLLYIFGEGNTGKGTYIELMRRFFFKSSILGSTFEKTFGLQNLYDSEIIIAPDLPKEIAKNLDAATLQSMISGESVSVAIKNKRAIQVPKWKAPNLWCANFLPPFVDSGGSITRRFALHKMTTPVKVKDTRMVIKLLKESYITVVKMVCAYHYYIKKIGDVAFSDWGEKLEIMCYDKHKSEFKKETSLLFQFLNGDRETNKTKNSQKIIVFKEGSYTHLQELKKIFKYFLKYNYPDVFKKYRWSSTVEESIIKSCGYTIKNKYICILCDGRGCDGGCNRNNRRKKKLVVNMEIVNLIDNWDELEII